eukprot:353422-Rhodomonas_salina.1
MRCACGEMQTIDAARTNAVEMCVSAARRLDKRGCCVRVDAYHSVSALGLRPSTVCDFALTRLLPSSPASPRPSPLFR